MARTKATSTASDGLFGWSNSLTTEHWKILLATFSGWIFDGYETYVLVIAVGPIMQSLLTPAQANSITFYSGLAVGITLLGWGFGGVIGGVITDYIGRKRMMMYSVLGYALFTGLTALSTSIWMFVAFRFITGLALGSEWGTGTALLNESWPDVARSKGAGFMQSGFGFGSLLGAVAWAVVAPLGGESWRYLFVFGIAPAFIVLYLRTGIERSPMWEDAMAKLEGSSSGREFPLRKVFADAGSRRIVITGSLIGLATTAGWYGINFLIADRVAAVAGQAHASVSGMTGIIYTIGSICGYLAAGWLADWFGRKGYLYFVMVGSLIITPITFLWVDSLWILLVVVGINGFFTLGQFAWFAIYLPELFPTETRGTSIGFVFNAARFVAFLFPISIGLLITTFGGRDTTAVAFGSVYVLGIVCTYFMPETLGKGLPD